MLFGTHVLIGGVMLAYFKYSTTLKRLNISLCQLGSLIYMYRTD